MTINSLEREQAVRALAGDAPCLIIRPLNTMDFPEYQPMRAVLKECFSPHNFLPLESSMEAVRCEYVNKNAGYRRAFDFANEIALEYLLRVVMPLLGIPSSVCTLMLGLTKQSCLAPQIPIVGEC